jgi:hypothetical protein
MAASIVYQVMSTLSPAACELEQILDDLEAQAMEIQSIHDTLSWELQKGPFGVFPSLSHVDNSSLSRSQACEPALKDDGNATDQVQVTGATFNDLSIWDELNPLTTTSEFPELDFLDEWSFPGDPPELRAGETNSPPATQGPPSAPMLTTTFEGKVYSRSKWLRSRLRRKKLMYIQAHSHLEDWKMTSRSNRASPPSKRRSQ